MFTADANKIIEERFQPNYSDLGLTLAGVQTSYPPAPFDGGLVF